MRNLGMNYDTVTIDYIAKVVPVIDEDGKKVIGSGQSIIEYCCFKDRRNDLKFNEKGKPIKRSKGWKPVKSLFPDELRKQIDRQLNWFMAKFRPFSNHLFHTLMLKPINSIKN